MTRKVGQSIVIDGNIIISVIEVNGKQVRLGVNAPKPVHVDREEVYRKKLNDAMEALQYV
ncbi:carbon storage regulator [Kocuria sp. CPCC 205274]